MAGSAGRRRGRGRRRDGRYGTAVGVLAVGLVALSAPAGSLAAQLAAVTGPSRPSVPQPVTPPAATLAPAPEPVVEPPVIATGPAPVAPRGVDLDVPHPVVPRGKPMETEPPPATCGSNAYPRRILPTVVPGPGTATLTWPADSDDDVQRYRVQAVSQRLVPGAQAEPPTQVAAQVEGCEQVTVRFAGLERGGTYVFWLEEEVLGRWAARWVQVGTTQPVVIG
ncbi:hypothetical protein ACI79D_23705 [Geodermatophilus sp. SYSU D00708]